MLNMHTLHTSIVVLQPVPLKCVLAQTLHLMPGTMQYAFI